MESSVVCRAGRRRAPPRTGHRDRLARRPEVIADGGAGVRPGRRAAICPSGQDGCPRGRRPRRCELIGAAGTIGGCSGPRGGNEMVERPKRLRGIDWGTVAAGPAYPSPSSWADEVLYFLLVDRFS